MKIAICQPTYLPWLGYFDLLDQVDTFVVLDSVQFEKQSWQQRNRIKTPAGLQWLTVPVVFRGRSEQRIDEVEIRDLEFVHKHLRALELNYRRTQYFYEYFPRVAKILEGCNGVLLADLNIQFIRWISEILGITTPLVRSSSMRMEGRRSALLVNICNAFEVKEYISPLGSSAYLLADIELFANKGTEVNFHNYLHPEYRQLFPPFLPYASVLDLIFNEGPDAISIIRRGRGNLLSSTQVALSTPVALPERAGHARSFLPSAG
jgi:WbqC-like protein